MESPVIRIFLIAIPDLQDARSFQQKMLDFRCLYGRFKVDDLDELSKSRRIVVILRLSISKRL